MGILDKAGLSLDSLNPMTNIPEGLPADQLTPYAYVPENNAPDPYAVQKEYIDDTLAQVEAQKKEVADQKNKAQEIISDIDATAPWLNAVPEIQSEIDGLRTWYSEEKASKGSKFDNYELQKRANDTKLKLDAIKNEHTKIMNQVYANANKIVDPNFYEDNAGEIYRQEVNKVFAENQGKSISELAPKIAAIDLPIKAEALPKWIVGSKVIPGMTSVSSTVSETDENAIQDNAEAAFASATEAKRANIIKVLQKTQNDETGEPYLGSDPSYEEASKAVQDYSMNFYRQRISQPRSNKGGGKKTTTPTFSENFVPDNESPGVKDRNLEKGDLLNLPLWTEGQNPVSMSITGYDNKAHSVVVVSVEPYWTGKERKFRVNAIPMDQIKINGTSITDVSQVTPGIVEQYQGSAQAYPLSEEYNAEAVGDKFPGIIDRVKQQIERDRKKKKPVYWEKGKSMY
jgi:hypothetical protein